MVKPESKLELEPFDKALEFVCLLGVVLLIGIPLYYYNKLPDTIPTHYGINGMPDSYGTKNSIWILPIVGILIFIGINYLKKFPHHFNYPQKVTEQNAKELYKSGVRMMRIINILVIITLTYLTYRTIGTALGHQSGLGKWVLLLSILLIIVVPMYYLIQMTRHKSKSDRDQ